jgi:serine/threonine-protein kinase
VRTLALSGLRVDKVIGKFDEKPLGTVVAQSPDADFFVPKNGSVDLTVSRGIEVVQVPTVVGLSQREAEANLSAVKLKVKLVTRDVNMPVGTVLEQLTPPGQQVAAGTVVQLIVASGKVEVPDVRGRTTEEAVSILGQVGFGVGLRYVESSVAPAGTVVAQAPGKVLAPVGSDVIIDIAQTPGTEPPATTDGQPPP